MKRKKKIIQSITTNFGKEKIGDPGYIWTLPNYTGMLFSPSLTQKPLLQIIGGLTGGKITDNFEFPTSSEYTLPARSQPAITEVQSVTAPAPRNIDRDQHSNVVQIFHESVDLTYVKQSNKGRLMGLNTAGAENNAPNERDFQIARTMDIIGGDINYTFHNGIYQVSTSQTVANTTRGMLELIALFNEVDALGVEINRDLIQELIRIMYNSGANFTNLVIFCGVLQKQRIGKIYIGDKVPEDRSIGGYNVQIIIEDTVGSIGIVVDTDVPDDTVAFYDVGHMAPVFQPVPDEEQGGSKGNFFYEPLGKSGATDAGQIFGQAGLDYGAGFLHGAITNLKV
ncbi:MAG: DUF5309 domain-containing protein [PVC group bacterium]|nr:DUF5309 domain-containing protein [PVC group bacterium]